jgi:hypothetical protein
MVIEIWGYKSRKQKRKVDFPNEWGNQNHETATQHEKELVVLIPLDDNTSKKNDEKAESNAVENIGLTEEKKLRSSGITQRPRKRKIREVKAIPYDPDEKDPAQLPPECLAVRSEFFELSVTRNDEYKSGDEEETWRNQTVNEVDPPEPPGILDIGRQERVEDVNLDHYDRGPTPEKIHKDETALHSRSISLIA